MVALLCSDHPHVPTGRIFEAGAGYYAEWQWRRSEGLFLDIGKPITVDDLITNWGTITDMSQCTDPIEDDARLPKQSKLVFERLMKEKKASKL